MRRLRRYRPSPALVVALLALSVALGGGAFAAVQSTPSQSGAIRACYERKGGELRVIKRGARCKRRTEQALTFARRGPRGSTGAQGATGDQGPVGPSNGYSVRAPATVPLAQADTTVATLQLPPGSYVLSAKLWITAVSAGTFVATAACNLVAGADSDRSEMQMRSENGDGVEIPMALALTHVTSGPATITLSCSRGVVTADANQAVITAIRVGGIG